MLSGSERSAPGPAEKPSAHEQCVGEQAGAASDDQPTLAHAGAHAGREYRLRRHPLDPHGTPTMGPLDPHGPTARGSALGGDSSVVQAPDGTVGRWVSASWIAVSGYS